MTPVQVRVGVTPTTDGLGYHRPGRHAAPADPWYVVRSPLVDGAWTAYRHRDEALEHAARLYLRYGAVCGVDDHDGLPT